MLIAVVASLLSITLFISLFFYKYEINVINMKYIKRFSIFVVPMSKAIRPLFLIIKKASNLQEAF